MRVVIIGSGLAGITTAFFLAREKVDVTVIDRAAGPGAETSFANGSLMAPSSVAPWNGPGLFGELLRSLGRETSPMLVRPREIPKLAGWGLEFLANSRRAAHQRATLRNASLARYSRQVLNELMQEEALEFEFDAKGSISVYRDQTSLREARDHAEIIAHAGVRHERLDNEGVTELEPTLRPISNELEGALYFPEDAVGDAHLFCREMHRLCVKADVEFRFAETVLSLEGEAGRLASVRTSRESYEADAYLLAAGSYSPLLLAPLELNLPVRPAKGYSISFPRQGLATRHPVLDCDLHTVVTPLKDRIRVAGTAEFTGFDKEIRPARVENLVRMFASLYPHRAASLDRSDITPWTGLRPMSADGMPFLGATPLSNLFLNTGHGASGWTLACGSAQGVADIILRRTPQVDISDFAFARRA